MYEEAERLLRKEIANRKAEEENKKAEERQAIEGPLREIIDQKNRELEMTRRHRNALEGAWKATENSLFQFQADYASAQRESQRLRQQQKQKHDSRVDDGPLIRAFNKMMDERKEDRDKIMKMQLQLCENEKSVKEKSKDAQKKLANNDGDEHDKRQQLDLETYLRIRENVRDEIKKDMHNSRFPKGCSIM